MTGKTVSSQDIDAMLPPYARHLGIALSSIEDGSPVLAVAFSADVMGRPGFLHGGALSGLLEMSAIAALRAAIMRADRKVRLKPVNITVDFMRGGREKTTYAAGCVIRLGQRVANVEAEAWQDDRSKIIAGARMNFLLSENSGK